uniref:BHLH domain-containing protein n=1 Tax=Scylla olivacea TaxID=85551 RepID=A0A0P4WJ94_SCYOL
MPLQVMTGKTLRSGEPRMRQDSGRGSPSRGKYALRPRTARRLQQDRVHQDAYIESGPKSKAPPLSRYRRKTANARERYRMRKINSAFDSLRSILPAALAVKPTSSSLTKITTLRLAARYIRALSKVLEEGETPGLYSMGSSLDTLQTPGQESLQLSNHFPLQEITFSAVSQWTCPWKTQLPPQSSPCTVSSVASCCCSLSSSSSSSSASSSNTSPAPPTRKPPVRPRHHEAITLLDFKMQDSLTYFHQIENLSSCDVFDVL